METKYNSIPNDAAEDYLAKLVHKIYKLLPMKEEGNVTIALYHQSLMFELTGFYNVFTGIENKSNLVSLIASLESLLSIEEHGAYKRKVFECINLSKKIM